MGNPNGKRLWRQLPTPDSWGLDDNKNAKKIQEKFVSITKDNYNPMNTTKGILVILHEELTFDQNINLINWD